MAALYRTQLFQLRLSADHSARRPRLTDRERLDWSIVKGLVGLDDRFVDYELLQIVAEWRTPDALAWLGDVASVAYSPRSERQITERERARRKIHWHAQQQAFDRVEEVAVDTTCALPGSFSSLLPQMISRTRAQMEWFEDEDRDDVGDEDLDINAETQRLEKRLVQLQGALERFDEHL